MDGATANWRLVHNYGFTGCSSFSFAFGWFIIAEDRQIEKKATNNSSELRSYCTCCLESRLRQALSKLHSSIVK